VVARKKNAQGKRNRERRLRTGNESPSSGGGISYTESNGEGGSHGESTVEGRVSCPILLFLGFEGEPEQAQGPGGGGPTGIRKTRRS